MITGLAVAVAGTGAPAAGSAHAAAGHASAPGAAAPAVQTVAYQTAHIEAALARVGNFIVQTTVHPAPGQRSVTWTDPRDQATRTVDTGGQGKVITWITTTVAGDRDHWKRTYADYASRTWWADTKVSGKLGHVAPGSWIAVSASTDARQIRQAIRAGELRIWGHGTIAGRKAIVLRYTHGKAAAMAYWVDARTFRPVRLDLPPGGPATVISISWLPRSAARVTATNTPQIPAGFSRAPHAPVG